MAKDNQTVANLCVILVQRLQEERVSLTQRRDSFKQLLEEMNQKYEALKTKLQENETHAQVSILHCYQKTHHYISILKYV